MTAIRADQAASLELREAVTALVGEVGEKRAQETLGLSRQALTRVIAGLPVRRGTIALVRGGIERR